MWISFLYRLVRRVFEATELKEGSDQYLWSSNVEKVLNKRKTRLPTWAWVNGVRLVRGIKRGILESVFGGPTLPNFNALARI